MIGLPLVSLDLELLDGPDGPEIIEVGAVKFLGARTLGTFHALVRPRSSLSFRVAMLTGLEESDFADASPLDDALTRLSTFLGGAPIVGQSIDLDVEQLRRAGLGLNNPLLDTFELAMLVRPGLPSYDLVSVAHDLGLDARQAHRALEDAELARAVFLRLAEEVADLPLDTISQVVRLAGPVDWPLKLVFSEAQRARVQQLLSARQPLDAGAGAGPLPPLDPGPTVEPLEPSERIEPVDAERLLRAMEPGGAIATALAGFEERAEQKTMLAEVARSFNNGETLLVEAGTGTGKSLAYLLPALHFSVANQRRVVVSTNTINLQDQLLQKDVPDLLRASGLPARVTVLKGRTNYLCLRRWLSLLRSDDLSIAERTLLIKSLLWLRRTSTGDRAELRLSSDEELAWGRIAAVAEACSPRRCSFHRDGLCFVARARRAVEAAHVTIVNHSLLLSDVVAGSQILPVYRHLVVDEAHHLEDEATSQLSRRVGDREVLRHLAEVADMTAGGAAGLLADAAAGVRRDTGRARTAEEAEALMARGLREAQELRTDLQRLFGMFGQLVRERAARGDGAQLTVRITPAVRSQPVWSDIDSLWGTAARAILALQRTLVDMLALVEDCAGRDEPLEGTAGELAAQLAFWEATRAHLSSVVVEIDPATIGWLAISQSGEVAVCTAPLEVGDLLRDQLFLPKESVVLTSATLTTAGSFRFIRDRLGLHHARELAVGSPFDYARSALIYLPSDAPEPYQAGFQRVVERVILDVVTELAGRTLVLFTSHSQLRTTYQALREPLDARKIIPLGQRVGGSSRNRMLETFRSGQACVLMGTSSFWEGVDVVGDALSCLIIVRLPFSQPNDPIFEARSEQFRDPFTQYSLPQAIIRFRQGFGRLIRSQTDRGVVVILDGRVRTRGYGRAFLRSLPDCEVRSGPAAEAGRWARAWLDRSARDATIPKRAELGSTATAAVGRPRS